MTQKIIVTEKEYRKAGKLFSESKNIIPASEKEDQLAAAVVAHQARAVVLGVDRYSGALYEALKTTGNGQGAIIARFGIGHDGVDKALATQNNIIVTNTPGVLDISVAEHTLWLLGDITRHITRLDISFRGGSFTGEAGGELYGKRLGILGLGNIGRRVARIASMGFGMQVWAAGNSSPAAVEQREAGGLAGLQKNFGVEHYTNHSEELFSTCDYVSVHLPSIAATRHYINAERLKLMKRTAVLVNTARGSVVDENALYDALSAGRIAGAALDVYELEPYYPVVAGKDLRRLPNTVLTPHIGSNTREANERMAQACLANLEAFFKQDLNRITRVN